MNPVAIFLAALVPLVLGFFWYNIKFGFGGAWMNAVGITMEQARAGSMAKMMLFNALLMLLLSFGLQQIVIHQGHLLSLFIMDPDFQKMGSENRDLYEKVMSARGHVHRTFGHGVLHGILGAIGIVVPILGTMALYERKKFRYFAINAGYWILSLALMGGILCAME
jgi:hypothetical protein